MFLSIYLVNPNGKKLLLKCSTPRVRLTPHKMIILENVRNITDENFIINSNPFSIF